jgi:acetyl-CoA C-acetyltransferase
LCDNSIIIYIHQRNMKEVYIVSVARTPIGNLGGVLSAATVIDLGKTAVAAAVQRAGISGDKVQELFMGHVLGANTGQAPATQVALAAGLPNSVVCTSVNKVCASGMKAIMLAAQSIALGDNDIVVAGGMESMSNAPHYLPNMRNGVRYGDSKVLDAIVRDGLQDPYDQSMMGMCGEFCAEEKNISKDAQDEYAWASYERARAAQAAGYFDNEIVPVEIAVPRKPSIVVSKDEEIGNARVTGLESVKGARAVFRNTVSAVNASKINDGAAAVVLMSGEKVKELGLTAIAKIVSYADANQAPVWFTTTPSLAIPKALSKAGLSMKDVDFVEVNEAFSVVALANMEILNIPHDKINVFGGAVALGHPIGVSGCRIVITLLSVLAQKGAKRGVASICNGGGGASAMVVELV